MMNDFLFQDCELLVAQDAGGQCGEKYSLGQDGSSHYLFEEIQ
jgi:hypothetical protein